MGPIISVGEFNGFNTREKEIAKQGLIILENALNDQTFHDLILGATFTSTTKTNKEILNRLLSGSDDMDARLDGIINLNFSMYYRWLSKVIGWVSPGERMIHVNRKYFGDPIDFASNALHEYAHMIGFDHKNARDFGSVPYKLNSLFTIWCERNGYFK
jgi:hypothetical protein